LSLVLFLVDDETNKKANKERKLQIEEHKDSDNVPLHDHYKSKLLEGFKLETIDEVGGSDNLQDSESASKQLRKEKLEKKKKLLQQ
jgi:hypothetical protein